MSDCIFANAAIIAALTANPSLRRQAKTKQRHTVFRIKKNLTNMVNFRSSSRQCRFFRSKSAQRTDYYFNLE